MSISLHVTITPERWPADAARDVGLRLVLRNEGRKPASISPGLAKLAAMASYAGIGILWNLGFFDDADVAVPLQELRRWYGPPGNPPSPAWANAQAVTLAPLAEHVTELAGCWIPNALLEARHLAPAALDPQGMDNIAGPSRFAGQPTPLADRIPLAESSVFVLGAGWSQLVKARTEDDFLRGHVVGFFSKPGVYEARLQYAQDSWMGVGAKLRIDAAPIAIHVG